MDGAVTRFFPFRFFAFAVFLGGGAVVPELFAVEDRWPTSTPSWPPGIGSSWAVRLFRTHVCAPRPRNSECSKSPVATLSISFAAFHRPAGKRQFKVI